MSKTTYIRMGMRIKMWTRSKKGKKDKGTGGYVIDTFMRFDEYLDILNAFISKSNKSSYRETRCTQIWMSYVIHR